MLIRSIPVFRSVRPLPTLALLLCVALPGLSQTHRFQGRLLDEQAAPLSAGTVVLLHPQDSTLAYFAISARDGSFELREVKDGGYLLQASFMGYRTLTRPLRVPRPEGGALGDILLRPLPIGLEGAEVVGEAVPLRIHGDTVFYHSAAFRTGPGATAEDLLKRMPGIEVDRNGTIKALGKEVDRVFVDGKEFFGSDPTLATRNIPADAIDRVKVYDKKSESAEFTGVDDGQRSKTIDLELKEDHKGGVFGSAEAGAGSPGRYRGNVRAFRFSDRWQLAGLGMLNNTNEHGFSFGDYMNFNGGMGGIVSGGGSTEVRMQVDDGFPLDMGQSQSGISTSGAGGLNVSRSNGPFRRVFGSYLVNGFDRTVEESSTRTNLLENGTYGSESEMDQTSRSLVHRVNLGGRFRRDSTLNLVLEADGLVQGFGLSRSLHSLNSAGDAVLSELFSNREEGKGRAETHFLAESYRVYGKGKSALSLSLQGEGSRVGEDIRLENRTLFGATEVPDAVLQTNDARSLSLRFDAGFTRKAGRGLYLVPALALGWEGRSLNRLQEGEGDAAPSGGVTGGAAVQEHRWGKPGLRFKWNRGDSQLTLEVATHLRWLETRVDGRTDSDRFYAAFAPGLSWSRNPRMGRNLQVSLFTSVHLPEISQVLPLENRLNPLAVVRGNPGLEPETDHRWMANYLLFDQFSSTSLMLTAQAGLIRNKITWSTEVTDSLVRISSPVNVPWERQVGGSLDFSTPIRKLGLKVRLKASEQWNRGTGRINGAEHAYRSLAQDYEIGIGNRKKQVWDLETGFGLRYTRSAYDLAADYNTSYLDHTFFADLRVQPGTVWEFEVQTDLTTYTGRGFQEALTVPDIRAGIRVHALKHRRGTFGLTVSDLLDRNRNVVRISELNAVQESRSNALGRTVLLSFKYRLNQSEERTGIEMNFHSRH
ncbi:MAG: TonB-dependent receptor [Bacteroidales bacterium]